MHTTLQKFGFPESQVAAYEHWVVLLRPDQVTLGSLVVAARSSATRLSDLSVAAFTELKTVSTHLEPTLMAAFNAQKFNYLMLMMVDPQVHYHVFPRYDGPREFHGQTFVDVSWPTAPVLSETLSLSGETQTALLTHLRSIWPQGR